MINAADTARNIAVLQKFIIQRSQPGHRITGISYPSLLCLLYVAMSQIQSGAMWADTICQTTNMRGKTAPEGQDGLCPVCLAFNWRGGELRTVCLTAMAAKADIKPYNHGGALGCHLHA